MSGNSKIEWTERTWNPVRGCTRVSPGCVNCYAERQAARDLPGMKSPTTGEPFALMTPSGPRWTGKVELIPHMLDIPLRRKAPTTYFVNSMSDLFHEGLLDADIDRIFGVMALCPQHTFQVLTKRAERMSAWFSRERKRGEIAECLGELYVGHPPIAGIRPLTKERALALPDWPLPNVWLGVSVEDQQRADERIPRLLKTPAAVRFLSVEPLLGPVDLKRIKNGAHIREFMRKFATDTGRDPDRVLRECAIDDTPWIDALTGQWFDGWDSGDENQKIDWVIVGGESGPGARPMDIACVRSIVQQCKTAGVACFVKQLGARPGYQRKNGWRDMTLKDRKGGDMEEWPEDLRVRGFPRAQKALGRMAEVKSSV